MTDAVGLAARIAAGELHSRELVDDLLSRLADDPLGAVAAVDPDGARARAALPTSGPFAGVPLLVKELLPYPGFPAAMGSRLFAQHVPAEHVPYTQALDDAGFVVVGNTTSPELGLLGSTETLLHGITHNPWGPQLSAGGSSGGSAAAVASGLVPLAHASDGGGSIRLPAALHGLFGFKASAGASAATALVDNPFLALVSEGCISHTVRDTDHFLAATASSPRGAFGPGPCQPLRIGVYTDTVFGVPATSEAAVAVEHAVAICRRLGHEVVAIDPPPVDGAKASRGFFMMAGAAVDGVAQMVSPLLGRAPGPDELEPFTLALHQWFLDTSLAERADAFAGLAEVGAAMKAFFETVDVTLCPTVGGSRPPLGHLAPDLPFDTLLHRTELLAGYTAVHNQAGAPAMSVPLGWTDEGLPVGVQFAASPGHDERLMQLAYQLEDAAPWAHRRPPSR